MGERSIPAFTDKSAFSIEFKPPKQIVHSFSFPVSYFNLACKSPSEFLFSQNEAPCQLLTEELFRNLLSTCKNLVVPVFFRLTSAWPCETFRSFSDRIRDITPHLYTPQMCQKDDGELVSRTNPVIIVCLSNAPQMTPVMKDLSYFVAQPLTHQQLCENQRYNHWTIVECDASLLTPQNLFSLQAIAANSPKALMWVPNPFDTSQQPFEPEKKTELIKIIDLARRAYFSFLPGHPTLPSYGPYPRYCDLTTINIENSIFAFFCAPEEDSFALYYQLISPEPNLQSSRAQPLLRASGEPFKFLFYSIPALCWHNQTLHLVYAGTLQTRHLSFKKNRNQLNLQSEYIADNFKPAAMGMALASHNNTLISAFVDSEKLCVRLCTIEGNVWQDAQHASGLKESYWSRGSYPLQTPAFFLNNDNHLSIVHNSTEGTFYSSTLKEGNWEYNTPSITNAIGIDPTSPIPQIFQQQGNIYAGAYFCQSFVLTRLDGMVIYSFGRFLSCPSLCHFNGQLFLLSWKSPIVIPTPQGLFNPRSIIPKAENTLALRESILIASSNRDMQAFFRDISNPAVFLQSDPPTCYDFISLFFNCYVKASEEAKKVVDKKILNFPPLKEMFFLLSRCAGRPFMPDYFFPETLSSNMTLLSWISLYDASKKSGVELQGRVYKNVFLHLANVSTGQFETFTTMKIVNVFKSKAKPILIEVSGENVESKQLIFKTGDDLSVDQGVTTLFKIFNLIWRNVSNNQQDLLCRFPPNAVSYAQWPISPSRGFLEFVGCAETVKKFEDNNLWKFIQDSDDEEVLRFIASTTGGFIAGLVMGVRDRHQDNMMVVRQGNVYKFMHIDFGWILNQSPVIDTHSTPIPDQLCKELGNYKMKETSIPGNDTPTGWEVFLWMWWEAFKTLRAKSIVLIEAAKLSFANKPELLNIVGRELQKSLRCYLSDEEAYKDVMAYARSKIVLMPWGVLFNLELSSTTELITSTREHVVGNITTAHRLVYF